MGGKGAARRVIFSFHARTQDQYTKVLYTHLFIALSLCRLCSTKNHTAMVYQTSLLLALGINSEMLLRETNTVTNNKESKFSGSLNMTAQNKGSPRQDSNNINYILKTKVVPAQTMTGVGGE